MDARGAGRWMREVNDGWLPESNVLEWCGQIKQCQSWYR